MYYVNTFIGTKSYTHSRKQDKVDNKVTKGHFYIL